MYGIPASFKAQEFYFQHGKPRLEQSWAQAQHVYQHQVVPTYKNKVVPVYKNKVLPVYNQKVAPYVNPYLEKAQPYINQVEPYYTNQVKPIFHQAITKAYEAKTFVENYNLPSSIKLYKDTAQAKIIYWIDKAENTDLMPILVKLYWTTIDFYNQEFLPVLNQSHVITRIKLYYKQHIKPFVDQHIVPILMEINHRVHLDQVVQHVLSWLPQERPIEVEEVVYTASSMNTQSKTEDEQVTPTTKEIPITPPVEEQEETAKQKKVIKTVTVVSKKTAIVTTKVEESTPASSSPTTTPVPGSASTSVVFTSTAASASAPPEATIGYHVSNDEDIRTHQESKATPSITTPQEEIEIIKEEDVVPKADKKEAIYCPTCNSAQEQMIVAPTDKNLVTANTEKHLHALPTDKEVFEVHTNEAEQQKIKHVPAQPTTPNTESYQEDVPAAEQIVIQAPIPNSKPVVVEEEQSDVTKEEDMVFSILPVKSEQEKEEKEEEEIVLTIQTSSAPTPSFVAVVADDIVIESVQEDKLVEEDIEIINEAIVQEVKEEKKEQEVKQQQQEASQQKIFVPPAIEKQDLVLESEKEHVKSSEEQVKEPFIKVEEPIKEPITTKVEEEPVVVVVNKKVVEEEEGIPQVKIRAPVSSMTTYFTDAYYATIAASSSVVKRQIETPLTE